MASEPQQQNAFAWCRLFFPGRFVIIMWQSLRRLAAARSRQRAVAAASSAAVTVAAAWNATVDSARAPKSIDLTAPGVEMLVHNISQSELVVRLEEKPLEVGDIGRTFLARPAFNCFMPVSEAINSWLNGQEMEGKTPHVLTSLSKYRVQYPSGISLVDEEASRRGVLLEGDFESATGSSAQAGAESWASFHLKGNSEAQSLTGKKMAEDGLSVPSIVAAYLPLVATVIPEWLRAIKRRTLTQPAGTPPPRKVLVLVSGAGQPRNEKANPADNSTEGTGWIIERFVRLTHPDIEVVHIPSTFGIFRYDDNVRFVKEQVLPVVESRRREVVATHGQDWHSHLKVTVCLADGAPARISAIQSAMRSYRPDFLHVWRHKTFWDTQALSEEDVESHTFKKLEMRPAVHRSALRKEDYKGLVDEMIRYKRQFEAVRDSDHHELGSFWLRKTGKAVLAVLLTRKPDGSPTYWRGMNVEVSMPTGTLCAERNAIGNALAADQSVGRSDMLAVAVLSVSLDPEPADNGLGRKLSGAEIAEVALNPLDPCGACMEWLKKISEVNPDFSVLTFTSTSCEKVFVTPIGDYG